VCALRYFSRRTIGAALESRVPKATATTFGNHLPLTRLGQVADQLACIDIMYDRAAGNHDVEIFAGLACLVAARAALPTLGTKLSRNPEIGERVH
jgi:hypothetical protein